MDDDVYRLDVLGGGLTRIATLPDDAWLGQIVPFEGMLLVPSGLAEETETGSSIGLIDVIAGSSFVVTVPGVGGLSLEAAVGDLLVFRGWSSASRYPVAVAYRLGESDVAWILEFASDPIPDDFPDEAIPGIHSMSPSPGGEHIIVRLAYPTSVFFDVLISSEGRAITEAYDSNGSLSSELHDHVDASAGWLDPNRLLYIPVDGSAFVVDTTTGDRSLIELPDITRDARFYGIYVSGDRAVISGTNGLSLADLDTKLVSLLVAAPCSISIGQLN